MWIDISSFIKKINVEKFRGITNIGIRPSVDDGDKVTIETFIYNFDEDIYGRHVEVIPEFYIRGEKTFDSLDALTEQITKDIEKAKSEA